MKDMPVYVPGMPLIIYNYELRYLIPPLKNGECSYKCKLLTTCNDIRRCVMGWGEKFSTSDPDESIFRPTTLGCPRCYDIVQDRIKEE